MGVGVSLAARGGGRGGAGARVFRRFEDIVFGAELRLNETCDFEGGQFYFFSKKPAHRHRTSSRWPFCTGAFVHRYSFLFYIKIIFKFSFLQQHNLPKFERKKLAAHD